MTQLKLRKRKPLPKKEASIRSMNRLYGIVEEYNDRIN